MDGRLPTTILITALAFLIALGACASSPTSATKPAASTQQQAPATAAPADAEAPRGQTAVGVARAQTEEAPARMLPAPDCGRKLQSLVDEAPPTSIVNVPACVYRETVTLNKPVALIAQPGAEIRGSDVWSDWSRRDGLWVHGGLPPLGGGGECLEGRDCQPPYQVFLDGTALERVGGRPSAGQFAVRGSEVRLADDPTGRTVEVSTRGRWITGRADDVRIEGFRMRHAANPAQNGALNTDGRSRWTVARNVLSDAHGPIVSLQGGAGHVLRDNDVSRSGQLGVHGTDASDVLVQGNRIHDNNLAGFDPVWEAGGLKMTVMSRLTLTGNEVSDNDGWGLWCDIDCRDTTISANRVHHNTRVGISYEISRRGTIVNNVVWENGLDAAGWGRGAGIICQNCTATTIADNLVAWCPDGITVVEQEREIISHVEQVVVRGNTIVGTDGTVALGWLTDRSPEYLFRPNARNQGADNRYWFTSREGGSERFAWDGPRRRLASFNATPGEESGRYLQDAEKAGILTAAGVPVSPADR
jgi:parallel beta-helix repeat protein